MNQNRFLRCVVQSPHWTCHHTLLPPWSLYINSWSSCVLVVLTTLWVSPPTVIVWHSLDHMESEVCEVDRLSLSIWKSQNWIQPPPHHHHHSNHSLPSEGFQMIWQALQVFSLQTPLTCQCWAVTAFPLLINMSCRSTRDVVSMQSACTYRQTVLWGSDSLGVSVCSVLPLPATELEDHPHITKNSFLDMFHTWILLQCHCGGNSVWVKGSVHPDYNKKTISHLLSTKEMVPMKTDSTSQDSTDKTQTICMAQHQEGKWIFLVVIMVNWPFNGDVSRGGSIITMSIYFGSL